MSRPTLKEELLLWRKGYHVIGIDEVGRGAFAGPLVVGAVVFPPFFSHKNTASSRKILTTVNDSKLLTKQTRESLVSLITSTALISEVSEVSVRIINRVGIGKANQIGFRSVIRKILNRLPHKKTFLLVDGFHARYVRGIGLRNQRAIIRGDQKSITIASASVIAKVHRDSVMENLEEKYSLYQFNKHKGYGTKLHRELIASFGLSSLHRKAFCHPQVHT